MIILCPGLGKLSSEMIGKTACRFQGNHHLAVDRAHDIRPGLLQNGNDTVKQGSSGRHYWLISEFASRFFFISRALTNISVYYSLVFSNR
ncbi:MAG: hypothetical protein PHQ23_11410 [Candidatus Wallbacteria bacterium]|nr:hypothetical protein [Candidatus Wallbacteria bacterium]